MRRADPPPLPRGEYRLIFTGMELVSMLFFVSGASAQKTVRDCFVCPVCPINEHIFVVVVCNLLKLRRIYFWYDLCDRTMTSAQKTRSGIIIYSRQVPFE